MIKANHVAVLALTLASAAGCVVREEAVPPPAPPPPPPPAATVYVAPPAAPPPPPPVQASVAVRVAPAPPAQPAPPAPPPASAAGSLGCFKDQGDPHGTGGRDLNGLAIDNPGMTTEMCTQTCAGRGFSFAATQYSTWCFCGNGYGRSGPAANCDMRCSGNANEMCGGAWANNVYQVRPGAIAPPAPPAPPAAPAPPAPPVASVAMGSVGCFKDQGDPNGTNGRDLNGLAVNNPGMTTEMCAQTCSGRGYSFAATQYATWCFCGNSYGRSGPAANCDMRCGGNANEMCGGAWANSVYRVR